MIAGNSGNWYNSSALNYNYKSYAGMFIGGDNPLTVITTENKNGKTLMIFKESYGNAFVPFLVSNYDTVYVADIRTFPFNAVTFAKENGIKEVLFINNTITSCTPPRIQNYLNLLQK